MTPRPVAVAVWLAGFAICLFIALRAEYRADLSAFLPRDPSEANEILVDQLRDGAVSRVILMGIDNAPAETLAALSKRLAGRLREAPDFLSVNNGESTQEGNNQAFLWDNRYLLSSAVTDAHFSEEKLKESLQEGIALLSSTASAFVKSYFPRDPTGELLHILDEIVPDTQPDTVDGVWFSADRMTALLVVQTKAAMIDVDAQQKALASIDAAFAQSRLDVPGAAPARIVKTGPVVFSVATRDRIKGDAIRYSTLATFLIASLMLAVYRSPRLLLFGLLPVVSGAIAGIAAVALAFGSVHGITLGFGVTLIGEGVDYPIYLFTQTAPGSRPEDTLKRIWPTLRLGVLTSIFGFSALLLSSFEGLSQLGVFSIAGLLAAISVTRWVIPALMRGDIVLPRPPRLGAFLLALTSGAPRLRLPLLVLSAGAAALLAAQPASLWNDDLSSLSPIPQSDKLTDQMLRTQMGAPDAGYLIVVEDEDRDTVLQRCEAISARLRELAEDDVLTGFQSPSAFLPSLSAQRARQKAIPERALLTARFARAVAGLPLRAGSFDTFFQDAEAARTGALVERRALEGTSFGAIADTLLVRKNGGWAAFLPLRGVKDGALFAKEFAKFAPPRAWFLDIKRDSDALYGAYRRQAILLSLGGIVAIVGLLFLALKDWRRVLRVTTPLAGAILVTAATLTAAGQGLTIFHLVGFLLVVAVGSNYSLFFERDAPPGEPREWVAGSLILANISTVIGFGVLSFSAIPVLYGIGTTVALGAFSSLVFSAVLSRRQLPG